MNECSDASEDHAPKKTRHAAQTYTMAFHREFCVDAGMIEQLQELILQDQDSQVISNCMSVLEQVGILANQEESHSVNVVLVEVLFLGSPA